MKGEIDGDTPRRLHELHPRSWRRPFLTSLALHVVLAGLMMVDWQFGDAPSDMPPPAAMTVELAAMPEAAMAPPEEAAPGPKQVEATPKPTPVPTPMKINPPPLVNAALKPDFVLPPKSQAKPVETRVAANEARETTAPQTVMAPKNKSQAPVEGENEAPPSDAEQTWEERIAARLARSKRYPAGAQRAGQQDTVLLRLVVDRKGRLVEAMVKQSMGFAQLDAETLELARRAGPYPAPPDSVRGDRIARIFAIDYSVVKRR
ncbi:energy transducer TonB [Novosphingobium sp. CF614]|uniref:energy transducer TonB n=1 Tax=Novosphingobium sp. CF614 TaxID=1884364 RepID=UPI0015A586D7|nr:TonB family protein [Novosphingobium sp. CF614]